MLKIEIMAPFEFHPLTPDRWRDFEKLFGARGACGGCWCMWWRLTRAEFNRRKGEGNRRAMKRLVASGEAPGILAYCNGRAVGWCSVAPREEFPVLQHSRLFKPVDDQKVWSVVCLFVRKDCRRHGLSVKLLEAAVAYVRSRGGRLVEGYPVEPKSGKMPDVFAYTGLVAAFHRAGFSDRARPSKARRIVPFAIPSAKP